MNGLDLAILTTNFGERASEWDRGDFNYDGVIDGSDFALLAENFGLRADGTAIALPSGDWAALDAFAAANGLMADVPEPNCGILAIVAAAGFLRRRSAVAGFICR